MIIIIFHLFMYIHPFHFLWRLNIVCIFWKPCRQIWFESSSFRHTCHLRVQWLYTVVTHSYGMTTEYLGPVDENRSISFKEETKYMFYLSMCQNYLLIDSGCSKIMTSMTSFLANVKFINLKRRLPFKNEKKNLSSFGIVLVHLLIRSVTGIPLPNL